MSAVQESIPSHLSAPSEAARAWFSRERGSEFKVTGIVDPDGRDGRAEGPLRLQLILCGSEDGQDLCLREHFEVTPNGGDFAVALVEDATPEIGSPAPLLDPAAGVRAGWLDEALQKHAFVLLLFYRGFW
ncbi:MAG: hypothetical protein JRF61_16490 [Deltaproteobacteria bacterium]|jgi:hypothetical protein|nr:hypothetical protein [Deltaproteobacteria bacterium]